MSNDEPYAVATIKFKPGKVVEAELTSIKNISPRTLEIAAHVLNRTYRGMKHDEIAAQHRAERKRAKAAAEAEEKEKALFEKKEDMRLKLAAKEKLENAESEEVKKLKAQIAELQAAQGSKPAANDPGKVAKSATA